MSTSRSTNVRLPWPLTKNEFAWFVVLPGKPRARAAGFSGARSRRRATRCWPAETVDLRRHHERMAAAVPQAVEHALIGHPAARLHAIAVGAGQAAPAPRRDTLRRRSASARCCTRAARGRPRAAAVPMPVASTSPSSRQSRADATIISSARNGRDSLTGAPLQNRQRQRRHVRQAADAFEVPAFVPPTTSRRYAVVFASSSALAQYARRCGRSQP